MLSCQRHLFPLADDDAYLNGASRTPQLHTAAAAARRALSWREEHSHMPTEAFFEPVEAVKAAFARLIHAAEPGRVALIPSASYGIATVARNLPLRPSQEIIVVGEQFPSNYYAWHRLCADAGATLRVIPKPSDEEQSWSVAVLEAIGSRTAAVAIGQVHWSSGYLFDLAALRRRTDKVGAWLIVDATQSLGALPLDVNEIRPDALIAGAYKWLLGPYGTGLAYYGPRMDGGRPLEENWINRAGSERFSELVDYRDEYRPLAARYSVGEHSNFIAVPMLLAGLETLNEWTPERVQAYTAALWEPVLDDLRELGITWAPGAHHLRGLALPTQIDRKRLQTELDRRRIGVSQRGELLRVSPHVYNRPDELHLLLESLTQSSVGVPHR